mmetsp:Transcript_33373/g.75395  ORF Transcript_33373/g.75395 Transcript_33373/m.75395 type:complete len:240 (-) Transcript_33373:167-886(-)
MRGGRAEPFPPELFPRRLVCQALGCLHVTKRVAPSIFARCRAAPFCRRPALLSPALSHLIWKYDFDRVPQRHANGQAQAASTEVAAASQAPVRPAAFARPEGFSQTRTAKRVAATQKYGLEKYIVANGAGKFLAQPCVLRLGCLWGDSLRGGEDFVLVLTAGVVNAGPSETMALLNGVQGIPPINGFGPTERRRRTQSLLSLLSRLLPLSFLLLSLRIGNLAALPCIILGIPSISQELW